MPVTSFVLITGIFGKVMCSPAPLPAACLSVLQNECDCKIEYGTEQDTDWHSDHQETIK